MTQSEYLLSMKPIMMSLPEFTGSAHSTIGLFQSILDTAVGTLVGIDVLHLSRLLAEREQIMSTALGDGIAIPHCRDNSLTRDIVIVVRFAEPIVWPSGSLDNKPVRAAFLLMASPHFPSNLAYGISRFGREISAGGSIESPDTFSAAVKQFYQSQIAGKQFTATVNWGLEQLRRILHDAKRHVLEIKRDTDELTRLTSDSQDKLDLDRIAQLAVRVKKLTHSLFDCLMFPDHEGNGT